MKIIEVHTPAELDQIKELFREYHQYLKIEHGLDISYQGVEDELATLPGKYAAPGGRLILALESDQPMGCAALRPINKQVCELKRMYVLPRYRGHGVGKAVAKALIQEASRIGYKVMRLDTGDFLRPAIILYESLGFKRIAPYNDVPEQIRSMAIFMELVLE
jgi:putative acetyltransferase